MVWCGMIMKMTISNEEKWFWPKPKLDNNLKREFIVNSLAFL